MAEFVFSAFADEASKDLSGQIIACKENGITHIEVRGINGINIADYTPETILPIKKQLDESGIKVSSIGSPFGKIKITDDFDAHFEKFKNGVELAKILEAKYIRMFSFFFGEDESFEEYRDEVIRRVKAMVDYADEHGIICCHENEKEIYGDTAERCFDLLEALNGKLRAIFDPANFIQVGQNIPEGYELLEPYIEYIHVKDCLYADGTVVPAGKGDGNIHEILKRYKAYAEGKRFLSLEPHLKVFKGLEDLENGNQSASKMKPNVFATSREAFDAASNALKEVLADI